MDALKIFRALQEEPMTIEEIAQKQGLTKQQTLDYLIELVDADMILPVYETDFATSSEIKKYEPNPKPNLLRTFEDKETTLMYRKLRLSVNYT